MQILKDDIRDAILKASVNEFYKNGFENTSMRTIAKKTNVTVGNLYRYYKNKEEILDVIVQPVLSTLMHFSEHHAEIHEKFKSQNLSRDESIDKIVNIFTDLFLNYRKEIIILLDGSKNTKYENMKEHMIKLYTSNVMDHFREMYPKNKLKTYEVLARALAISILEGVCEIIREAGSDKEMIEFTHEFFRFYYTEKFV